MKILQLLSRLNPMGPGLQKVLSDCFTSWNGDWDPSRLFGYLFAIVVSIQFVAQSAYDLIKNGHWDPLNYSLAAAGIGGMYAAVAAGVRIKSQTENPAGTPPSN